MLDAFAERVRALEPEGAYRMLARARALEGQGRQVFHLEIGQPDVATFEHISRAGIDAIEEGQTRYAPVPGVEMLREAIARDAGARRGIQVSPSQVVVGPGTKPALFFPTLALVRPGDEVIYPDPGFPTYEAMITVAGGTPVPAPLREEDDFAFDLEWLAGRVGSRTRLIVLNSPSNPTGGVLSRRALERIAALAIREDFWVISDEIYSRITYGVEAPSIGSLPGMQERTVICDGFSKTYAMTGWRLGFGIMPEALAERVELLLTHAAGSTATFTQYAGLAAIEGPQEPVDRVLQDYRRKRDQIVEGLNAIRGIRCRVPQGALYAFPNVEAFGRTSSWLADYLLEEAGVAVLAGSDFGAGGAGYLRLCFATSPEVIRNALRQMAEALARLGPS
jgi:aspartate/methionine/tyrosine aminotransferase